MFVSGHVGCKKVLSAAHNFRSIISNFRTWKLFVCQFKRINVWLRGAKKSSYENFRRAKKSHFVGNDTLLTGLQSKTEYVCHWIWWTISKFGTLADFHSNVWFNLCGQVWAPISRKRQGIQRYWFHGCQTVKPRPTCCKNMWSALPPLS